MTAPDVRTAAREAATRHFPGMGEVQARKRKAFIHGVVWGAALVSEGIRLADFRGDGVYRDAEGVIWQRMEDTRKAVETAIAATAARVTSTQRKAILAAQDALGCDIDGLEGFMPGCQGHEVDITEEGLCPSATAAAEAVLALLSSRQNEI